MAPKTAVGLMLLPIGETGLRRVPTTMLPAAHVGISYYRDTDKYCCLLRLNDNIVIIINRNRINYYTI